MLHKPKPKQIDEQIDVIILGGGIAGCLSALKIAETGMRVLILEKQDELLLGASNITPGRMGLGFHYPYKETALAYLNSTVNFVKEFPNFCIGRDTPGGYLQRGRYFIVKNSLFHKDSILSTYQAINEEYARLVKADKSNKVFGEPENFFRILDPKEYENDVNMDIVEVGVETAECLLDWPDFRANLLSLLRNENIVIQTNCKAETISRGSDNKYLVKANSSTNSDKSIFVKFESEFIVNATWEHVEEITKRAGLTNGLPKDGRTNRLKVLAEVQLPEDFQRKYSMFFAMGPHCMFSNMGNGTGLVSYAPKTNVASSSGIYIPPKIEIFTKTNRTEAEEEAVQEEIKENKFGEKIISGTAEYIKGMRGTTVIGLRFGVVKTQGDVDIFDHASPFHMRNYSGVEEITSGWINNSAMKLLYGLDNANLVVNIIKEQKKFNAELPYKIGDYFSKNETEITPEQQKSIASTLRFNFFKCELAPDVFPNTIAEIEKTVKNKSLLNTEFIEKVRSQSLIKAN